MEVGIKAGSKRELGGEREALVFFLSHDRELSTLTPSTSTKLEPGGNIGLMGAVAESVQAGGQQVIGVIPKALTAREVRW